MLCICTSWGSLGNAKKWKIHEFPWKFWDFSWFSVWKLIMCWIRIYIYIHFGASRGSLLGPEFVKNRSRIGLKSCRFHHLAGMLIKTDGFQWFWVLQGAKMSLPGPILWVPEALSSGQEPFISLGIIDDSVKSMNVYWDFLEFLWNLRNFLTEICDFAQPLWNTRSWGLPGEGALGDQKIEKITWTRWNLGPFPPSAKMLETLRFSPEKALKATRLST